MLSVFFIEIDCPQLIKYLVYLTRLKNEKSQKSHAIEEFNSIIAASQKVSYIAHIPYFQPHKLADKFSSNKNQMMCLVQEMVLLVNPGMHLKNMRMRKHRVLLRNP